MEHTEGIGGERPVMIFGQVTSKYDDPYYLTGARVTVEFKDRKSGKIVVITDDNLFGDSVITPDTRGRFVFKVKAYNIGVKATVRVELEGYKQCQVEATLDKKTPIIIPLTPFTEKKKLKELKLNVLSITDSSVVVKVLDKETNMPVRDAWVGGISYWNSKEVDHVFALPEDHTDENGVYEVPYGPEMPFIYVTVCHVAGRYDYQIAIRYVQLERLKTMTLKVISVDTTSYKDTTYYKTEILEDTTYRTVIFWDTTTVLASIIKGRVYEEYRNGSIHPISDAWVGFSYNCQDCPELDHWPKLERWVAVPRVTTDENGYFEIYFFHREGTIPTIPTLYIEVYKKGYMDYRGMW